jgi:hypothetical protein
MECMCISSCLAGLKLTDLNELSSNLFNFFPQQALSRLPSAIFKSLTTDQLQHFNIEQIKAIPNSLLKSLNKQQMTVINQILNPFQTSG